MELFRYIKQEHDDYKVYTTSQNVYIGDVYKEVDGYYVFWPHRERFGFWSAEYMIEIGNKLNELNKEWDDIVKNDPSI